MRVSSNFYVKLNHGVSVLPLKIYETVLVGAKLGFVGGTFPEVRESALFLLQDRMF